MESLQPTAIYIFAMLGEAFFSRFTVMPNFSAAQIDETSLPMYFLRIVSKSVSCTTGPLPEHLALLVSSEHRPSKSNSPD